MASGERTIADIQADIAQLTANIAAWQDEKLRNNNLMANLSNQSSQPGLTPAQQQSLNNRMQLILDRNQNLTDMIRDANNALSCLFWELDTRNAMAAAQPEQR